MGASLLNPSMSGGTSVGRVGRLHMGRILHSDQVPGRCFRHRAGGVPSHGLLTDCEEVDGLEALTWILPSEAKAGEAGKIESSFYAASPASRVS